MRRSRPNKGAVKREEEIRIGKMIRASTVRLIGGSGPPEIIPLEDAIKKAEDENLDLVQISTDQDIPAVKIVDYGKYRFNLLKRKKEAKKKQKVIVIKEVKMRPKIGKNDFNTKLRHTISFLNKGDKVKVTMMFRGRENAHKDFGLNIIENFKKDLTEHANIEKEPTMEGPNITMVVSPRKLKK